MDPTSEELLEAGLELVGKAVASAVSDCILPIARRDGAVRKDLSGYILTGGLIAIADGTCRLVNFSNEPEKIRALWNKMCRVAIDAALAKMAN